MPELVVDPLEVIEIDEQQCSRGIVIALGQAARTVAPGTTTVLLTAPVGDRLEKQPFPFRDFSVVVKVQCAEDPTIATDLASAATRMDRTLEQVEGSFVLDPVLAERPPWQGPQKWKKKF